MVASHLDTFTHHELRSGLVISLSTYRQNSRSSFHKGVDSALSCNVVLLYSKLKREISSSLAIVLVIPLKMVGSSPIERPKGPAQDLNPSFKGLQADRCELEFTTILQLVDSFIVALMYYLQVGG